MQGYNQPDDTWLQQTFSLSCGVSTTLTPTPQSNCKTRATHKHATMHRAQVLQQKILQTTPSAYFYLTDFM